MLDKEPAKTKDQTGEPRLNETRKSAQSEIVRERECTNHLWLADQRPVD